MKILVLMAVLVLLASIPSAETLAAADACKVLPKQGETGGSPMSECGVQKGDRDMIVGEKTPQERINEAFDALQQTSAGVVGKVLDAVKQ